MKKEGQYEGFLDIVWETRYNNTYLSNGSDAYQQGAKGQ